MVKKLEKKVYQYTAVFEESSKNGGFTAIIPALPGCISEGDSFEESVANIQEAASLYLETMKNTKPEDQSVIVAPVKVRV